MRPMISIVIANYNYGRFLDEAIQSVLSQTCQDFELIVCDAASSDDSVDIIRRYANGLPPKTRREDFANCAQGKLAWWCSEKDRGQSDAFNKGFAQAKGRFLTWLNADDVLLPGAIERLKSAVGKHPACEWFVGGCFWLDPEMKIIRCGRGRPFSEIRYREGNVSVWGPSSVFTKRLLDAVGGFDLRFKYSMDSDIWMKFACKEHARYKVFSDYAWGLRLHPEAKMSGHNFTADGKFDVNAKGKDLAAFERKMQQLRNEYHWIEESAFPYRKSTRLSRLLSASWGAAFGGRVDTRRYAGRHYMEVYK